MAIRSSGRWGITAAALLLAGCHQNPYGYNYGPYAPGPMYGPGMAPQGGYITPGPVYAPQNSGPTLLPGNPNFPSNSGSPTLLNPGSTNPGGSPLNLRPDPNGSDAPPFQPNPGAGNPRVPEPLEPGFDSSPPPAAALPRAIPFASTQPLTGTAVSTASAQGDFFEEPRRVPVDSDPFSDTPATNSAGASVPYGFDGQTYTWLRGIVDYDQESRTWAIIYNLAPDVGDKFGGSFIFAPHEDLKRLQPGAFVLVQGRADPGRPDGRGKPRYEVAKFVKITLPENIQ